MASRFEANGHDPSLRFHYEDDAVYDDIRNRAEDYYNDDDYDRDLDHAHLYDDDYSHPLPAASSPSRPCWIHIRGPDLKDACEPTEPHWILCPEQRSASFLVIREQTSTPAALSRCSTPADVSWSVAVPLKAAAQSAPPRRPVRPAIDDEVSDIEAEQWVKDNVASFRKRFPDSPHERILLSLIHPKADGAEYEYELDNTALEGIFSSVNEVFFGGQLTHRVAWHWSHEAAGPEYDSRVVGHTSLRESAQGGFETLVILSSPILRDKQYNRRLLISAFVHELIHCFLFIRYGFAARRNGGHTEGFRAIAELIDSWAGRGRLSHLYLCDMEADLRNFRVPADRLPPAFHDHQGHDHDHKGAHHSGHRMLNPHEHDRGGQGHGRHHKFSDSAYQCEYHDQLPDAGPRAHVDHYHGQHDLWCSEDLRHEAAWAHPQRLAPTDRWDFIDISRHKAAAQPHYTFPRQGS